MRKTDSMRVDQKFTDEEFSRKKIDCSAIYREWLLTTIPTMKMFIDETHHSKKCFVFTLFFQIQRKRRRQ